MMFSSSSFYFTNAVSDQVQFQLGDKNYVFGVHSWAIFENLLRDFVVLFHIDKAKLNSVELFIQVSFVFLSRFVLLRLQSRNLLQKGIIKLFVDFLVVLNSQNTNNRQIAF